MHPKTGMLRDDQESDTIEDLQPKFSDLRCECAWVRHYGMNEILGG